VTRAAEGPARAARTIGGSAWARIGASVALAVLVGVVVWLIVKDNHEAGKLDVPSASSSAATLNTVRTLPGELGHDVYWAGPDSTATYELTQVGQNLFIRYLPAGVDVGDPRPDFLTVGTYPVPNAYEVLARQAKRRGGHLRRAARGGIAVWSDARPQSVYLAYPGPGLQVEIYDTSATRARRLAITGAVKPIR
jgi:hypothetical protein